MRCVALGTLAAVPLAGCSLVFGLDPTHAYPDSGLDAAPPLPVYLQLRNARIEPTGLAAAPVDAPIPDLTGVEIGPLDGTTPHAVSIGVDGMIDVREVVAAPWRLVYRRANGISIEHQNLPIDARIAEPLFGPYARVTVGANAGYQINPVGWTGNHTDHRVFTTSVWTEGTGSIAGAVVTQDLMAAKAMSGTLSLPGPGARGFLVDYQDSSGCTTSAGVSQFDASNAGPPRPTVNGDWSASAQAPTVNWTLGDLTPAGLTQLGESFDQITEQFGFVPSDAMPLFTRPADPTRSVKLPNPPIVRLRRCAIPAGGAIVVQPQFLKDNFPSVVHTETSASRKLPDNALLINGIGAITPLGANAYNVDYNVAIAKGVTITGTAPLDLFGAPDQASLPVPASGLYTLRWDVDVPGAPVSFWEVTLLKVSGTLLFESRVYVTRERVVTITAADLAPTSEYVLAVTAYSGRPGVSATTADFRTASLAQQISRVHTRSFRTP